MLSQNLPSRGASVANLHYAIRIWETTSFVKVLVVQS